MTTKKQIIVGTLAGLLGAGIVGGMIKTFPTDQELADRVVRYQEEQRPISQAYLHSYMKMYHGGFKEFVGITGENARDLTGDGVKDGHYICNDGAIIAAKEQKIRSDYTIFYWVDLGVL